MQRLKQNIVQLEGGGIKHIDLRRAFNASLSAGSHHHMGRYASTHTRPFTRGDTAAWEEARAALQALIWEGQAKAAAKAAAKAESVTVLVVDLTGQKWKFKVNSLSTVANLKEKIKKKTGIPLRVQQLIYKKKRLGKSGPEWDENQDKEMQLSSAMNLDGTDPSDRTIHFVRNLRLSAHEMEKLRGGGKGAAKKAQVVSRATSMYSPSVSFSGRRAALDTLGKQRPVKRLKASRGANKAHWIPQQGVSTDQTWDFQKMSKAKVQETRLRLAKKFPMAKKIMGDTLDKAKDLLDQKAEGACTFVGLLNCSILSGRKTQVKKAAVQSKWPRYWKRMVKEGRWMYGSPDLASTLDAMLKVGILEPQGLNYIPVRSGGAREMHYNVSFWVDEEQILAKYGISQADYDAAPFVYQNLNLLETLVDNGIPVAVNALEHTRTLVGYDKEKFLFADNWGPSNKTVPIFVDKSYAALEDDFAAGYSTISKWGIATNVRDIAFWEPQRSSSRGTSAMRGGENGGGKDTPTAAASASASAEAAQIALGLAAANGDATGARKAVVEDGANVGACVYRKDGKMGGQCTAVYVAAGRGHTDVLAALLADPVSADPDHGCTGTSGATPCFIASSNNHPEAVEMLLKHNADPDKGANDGRGWTPLHTSCANSRPEVVKLLMAFGAKPDIAESYNGMTPFLLAATNGNYESLRALAEGAAVPGRPGMYNLDVNAVPTSGTWKGMTALDIALHLTHSYYKRERAEVVAAYLRDVVGALCAVDLPPPRKPPKSAAKIPGEAQRKAKKARVNHGGGGGGGGGAGGGTPSQRALGMAAAGGDAAAAVKAVEEGADVDAACFYIDGTMGGGGTAVYVAARRGQGWPDRGHTDVLAALLAPPISADPNMGSTKPWGQTPLAAACQFPATEAVRMLLEHDADVNKGTNNGLGSTPLYISCDSILNSEVVTVLMEFGADPNIVDTRSGMTPIMLAVDKGNDSVLRALVEGTELPGMYELGVNAVATGGKWAGKTALDIAMDPLDREREGKEEFDAEEVAELEEMPKYLRTLGARRAAELVEQPKAAEQAEGTAK